MRCWGPPNNSPGRRPQYQLLALLEEEVVGVVGHIVGGLELKTSSRSVHKAAGWWWGSPPRWWWSPSCSSCSTPPWWPWQCWLCPRTDAMIWIAWLIQHMLRNLFNNQSPIILFRSYIIVGLGFYVTSVGEFPLCYVCWEGDWLMWWSHGTNFKTLTLVSMASQNTSLAAPGALAHRLQHLTARLIQNGRGGLERCLLLGLWASQATFAK